MFAVSRIAHYMKAMMRDKIGSFASPTGIQAYLQRWIDKFVTTDDSASQETKAEFPLREASIEVSEVPGGPACIARCPSSGPISSSTSCRCPCASWPNCRPARTERPKLKENPKMKDIYVEFKGSDIKGDSRDAKHKDTVEVYSWSHTMRQPKSATASAAGGHTAERVEHGEMVFSRTSTGPAPSSTRPVRRAWWSMM